MVYFVPEAYDIFVHLFVQWLRLFFSFRYCWYCHCCCCYKLMQLLLLSLPLSFFSWMQFIKVCLCAFRSLAEYMIPCTRCVDINMNAINYQVHTSRQFRSFSEHANQPRIVGNYVAPFMRQSVQEYKTAAAHNSLFLEKKESSLADTCWMQRRRYIRTIRIHATIQSR